MDANGKLTGFYTDGDFRRQMEFAFEAGDERFLKLPIRDAMTERPLSIEPDRLVTEATRIMRERKVDQLPVVDGDGRPIGLIDVQDLLDVRLLG